MMYASGDKYCCAALKTRSLLNLEQHLCIINLKHQEEVDAVLKAIRIIYTTTPSSDRGMRLTITAFLAKPGREFCRNQDFITLIKSGLDDGQIAFDVIGACTTAEKGTMNSDGLSCQIMGHEWQ